MADIDRDQTDLELDVLLIEAFNAMAEELHGDGSTTREAYERLRRKMLAAGEHKAEAARQRWGKLPKALEREITT